MSGFTNRENQLFDILQMFTEYDVAFVVIGGYAVSAFQHRFSVDADLVITAEYLDEVTTLLRDEGYEQVADRTMDEGRFVAFEKDADLPVTVDVMVDTVHVRQTDATWPYDELAAHAESRTIKGSERSVTVRIPEQELLMAMKLHSGRQTDARDVVALADDVDFEAVTAYLHRGDREHLRSQLQTVLDTITSDAFADGFKGVFSEQDLPTEQIDRVEIFLRNQIADLDA